MLLLPERTRQTVHWMAYKLDVMSFRGWREEEEHLLRQHYPALDTAAIRFLSGRTPEAIKIRACDLSIRYEGDGDAKQNEME